MASGLGGIRMVRKNQRVITKITSWMARILSGIRMVRKSQR